MSRILCGRGSSLAWTAAAPALTVVSSPIIGIVSYTFSDTEEFEKQLDGLARVESAFKATRSSQVTIEVRDIKAAQEIPLGQGFTNLKLTIEGAVQHNSVAANNNYEITLASAFLESRTDQDHDNTHSAPSSVSLTFTLVRDVAAVADPAITKAIVTGGT
jgi:hypothetical protein